MYVTGIVFFKKMNGFLNVLKPITFHSMIIQNYPLYNYFPFKYTVSQCQVEQHFLTAIDIVGSCRNRKGNPFWHSVSLRANPVI